MKKKILTFTLLIGLLIFNTACGAEFPRITEEQEEAIGEYAAFTLLKYDANSRSRLVPESEVEEANQKMIARALRKAEEQENKNNKPNKSDSKDKNNEEDESSIVEVQTPTISMEEFLGLPAGINSSYVGYDVCDTYPNGGEGSFAIDASNGKKLLIAKFDFMNTTNAEIEVDLFSKRISSILTMQDGYRKASLTTMLMDDMSSYIGKIAAGTSERVVLVFEINNEEITDNAVSNLILKIDSNKYTIQ